MCLAVVQYGHSKRISKEQFETAASVNNDGIGMAFNENGRLFVKKGFDSVDLAFDRRQKRSDSSTPSISIRLFVVASSPQPNSRIIPSKKTIAPQPPGPGFPEHAPSL